MNKEITQQIWNQWKGRSIDWDSAYGSQCVDLTKMYFSLLGIKEPLWGNAYQYIDHPLMKKYCDEVRRDQMQTGDIIVWDNTGARKYGHVGIFWSYRTQTGKSDDKPTSAWVLQQDGDITDRNFRNPNLWAKLESAKWNLSTFTKVYRPNPNKINPKSTPIELIDKLSEPTKIPVRERVAEKQPLANHKELEDAPVLKVEPAKVDKVKDDVRVKNIKLKQRLVKEKQAQVSEMKDSDSKRVSKQTKRNSGYIGAFLWSIWSFFDDRVEFLMIIEDTIGHDTLMNLILLVLPVFIYDALNKYAFSRFKQQGKINMLLMPLLIGVGDAGYQDRKAKAMADIRDLEDEITSDLGDLVADKVLR